ncbi:cell division protein FtsW (lipid II flippase) [Prauserella isguenensis]|uniref:Cell division protein FtsW (Lipid II flippase) n=1 Tax=Prauserella isguenensis TaxID=1470180 RepID=A0A839RW07_9PSEU|nr:FtsW/RodA/SpoVE family cell cycle protein [Prauserella isguenensis]MBB3049596.1 cell division protein FtsW (lipid II flippase) [Prauserella isguenensis]
MAAAAGNQSAVGQQYTTNPPRELPKRRGTELMLLAFAAVIVTTAFVLVQINQEQSLSWSILWYGGAYLAIFSAAHVAVRRWAPYADPLILPCVALLNGLGLVAIYRLDLAEAERARSLGEEFAGSAPRQVLYTVVALALFLAVLRVIKDHRTLTSYAYTAGLAGLILLALPAMLPASLSEVNGAKVWLRLPGFSIQPGEFAKILLMIFFASFLVAKRDLFMTAGKRILGVELPRARDLGPIIIAAVVCLGILVFERDLGTALLFFGITLMMLYVATERAIWVVVGLSMFLVGAFIAYQLFTHVQQRVTNWIDPLATYDDPGGGYQIAQGLFGLGTGGVFGTGLGAGRPEMVPEAHTDFISAALGEEIGFVGLAAVLLLYLLLAMRGMRSALAVRDTFGKLLGGGLSFAIVMQVFVIVGGVTKLIPMTGVTTPFLSAGGSSLLANYILVALLLRISDTARRPIQQKPSGEAPPKQLAPIAEAHTVMVQRPPQTPAEGGPALSASGGQQGPGQPAPGQQNAGQQNPGHQAAGHQPVPPAPGGQQSPGQARGGRQTPPQTAQPASDGPLPSGPSQTGPQQAEPSAAAEEPAWPTEDSTDEPNRPKGDDAT